MTTYLGYGLWDDDGKVVSIEAFTELDLVEAQDPVVTGEGLWAQMQYGNRVLYNQQEFSLETVRNALDHFFNRRREETFEEAVNSLYTQTRLPSMPLANIQSTYSIVPNDSWTWEISSEGVAHIVENVNQNDDI